MSEYVVQHEYKHGVLEMRLTLKGTDLTAYASVPSRPHDPKTYTTLKEYLKFFIERIDYESTHIQYKKGVYDEH